jgi:hypothetical protein
MHLYVAEYQPFRVVPDTILGMRRRLNGLNISIGGLGAGANWETVPGDEEIAKETIIFLEDRRVLFGLRQHEDGIYCVRSVNQIRRFLTKKIPAARGEDLEASLREMRRAASQFVNAAGTKAMNFRGGWAPGNAFDLALKDLQMTMGREIAVVAIHFDLEVQEDLLQILPRSA